MLIHKQPNTPDKYAERNNLCYSPMMCDQVQTDLSFAALSGKIICWPNDNLHAAKLWCTAEAERAQQDFFNQLSIRVSVSENFSVLKVLWKTYREKSLKMQDFSPRLGFVIIVRKELIGAKPGQCYLDRKIFSLSLSVSHHFDQRKKLKVKEVSGLFRSTLILNIWL